ncbi:uncharacterized protein LOC136028785 isoform X1 [Artemia franciscana]|uniref:uncharacterized protein LOC136028785 isoform X1 n=1 Tax=Artemia franciscana TaxID=6661 RepID=UPI0032DBAC06
MHSIFTLEEPGKVHYVAFEELKKIGIRESIKSRKPRQDLGPKDSLLFGRKIHELPLESVKVGPDQDYMFEIPSFVVTCCQKIISNVETEGLFRKAGSAKRQKEAKLALNNGENLNEELHVIDVANILKQFFRELPEPLVPRSLHDIFISCSQLKEKKVEALQLSCLMISNLTALATLCYICQVLDVVAASSSINMMNVSNLAIIMVPSLMPLPEISKSQRRNLNAQNPRLLTHKDVIELLIKNSAVLGNLPDCILPIIFPQRFSAKAERRGRSRENLSTGKKKRRSGSFSRMMEGIRKIVGRSQSDSEASDSNLDTESIKSQKRKKEESFLSIPSSKKKRKIGSRENVFDTTPFTPEMRHNFRFGTNDHTQGLFQSPALSLEPSPSVKQALGFAAGECKKSKKFFTPKRLALRNQSKRIGPLAAAAPINKAKEMKRRLSLGKKDKTQDREESSKGRLSEGAIAGGSRRSHPITACFFGADSPEVSQCMLLTKGDVQNVTESQIDTNDGNVDEEKPTESLEAQYKDLKFQINMAAQELIEAVKDDPILSPRVNESVTRAVAEEFQKLVDDTSELAQNCTQSNEVVKIMSKELKIRRSAEHKVIRSPSARKIGAVRRRSREVPKSLSHKSLSSPRRSRSRLTRSHSAIVGGKVVKVTPLLVARNMDRTSVRSNLRRGKPNTVRTGLPEPSPLKRRSRGRYSMEANFERKQLNFSNMSNNSIINTTIRDETQPDILENSSSDIEQRGSVLKIVKAFENDSVLSNSCDYTPSKRLSNGYHSMDLRNSPKFKSVPENLEEIGSTDLKSRRESIVWQSAENFMKSFQPIEIDKKPRDSIKRLRAENAGKVHESVKIFDHKEDPFSRRIETYQSLPVRSRGKSVGSQLPKSSITKEGITPPEIRLIDTKCQKSNVLATPRSRANIDQLLARSCEKRNETPIKVRLTPGESAFQQENIEVLLSKNLRLDEITTNEDAILTTPRFKPFLTPLKDKTPRIGRSKTQRRASPLKPLLIGEVRRRSPRLQSSPNLAINYNLTPKPKSDFNF